MAEDHGPTGLDLAPEAADRPLEDVRIVAVEQYGAGPFATLQLAELGADVIKVEHPGARGDVGRHVPPSHVSDDSLFFQTFNHGKRSIALDLRNTAGRDVFEGLVRESDAVFSNLRGDVPGKLRLHYDDLKDVNPQVVCCSLSAFGANGPRAHEPGYDYLVQGLAGWMSLTGEPNGPPTKTGLSLVDFASGYAAAAALLAAVHAARRTGRGRDCDLSLFGVGMNLLTYVATWYLSAGIEPERMSQSAHPTLVPFQNFETASGWMVVGCAKEQFWHRLADTLDDPFFEESRFDTFEGRREHRDELVAALTEAFLTERTEVWIDRLSTAGVPCARVNDVPAAMEEEQVRARKLLRSFEHPDFGEVTVVRSPLRLTEEAGPTHPAPALGADTQDVMRSVLNLSETEVERLRDEGAFGA